MKHYAELEVGDKVRMKGQPQVMVVYGRNPLGKWVEGEKVETEWFHEGIRNTAFFPVEELEFVE